MATTVGVPKDPLIMHHSTTATSITPHTDLLNGTTYYFMVTALNASGESIASAEVSATPMTVPSTPTIGTASAGNAQATVSFTAPTSNGGAVITGYTVVSNPAGGVDSHVGTTNLTHIITNLTNDTPYTFTVTATNSVGTGAASAASNSVTPAAPPPAATAPSAPTIGVAVAGNTQISVAFTAPASNGGSAITSYTATCGTFTATGAASPLTVTGLTNVTAYTCTVTATNAIGTSAASAASNSVTPFNNTWVTKTSMPTARWASGLGEINGVIYVAGGFNPAIGGHLTTVEAYTVASNSWLAKNQCCTTDLASQRGRERTLVYHRGYELLREHLHRHGIQPHH